MKKKSVKSRDKKAPAKSRGSDAELFLKLGKNIWPIERDVLFRPDRYKYVRRAMPAQNCVFCEIEANEPSVQTLCLGKTKHSMIVLNKYPYNSGHLLVLPRKHGGEYEKLSSEQSIDLAAALQKTIALLKSVYKPGGLNIGLNLGAVAGAGIPEHLHFHVIPRWAGDLNFFPLVAETKVVVEPLESSYQRLQESFAKFFSV